MLLVHGLGRLLHLGAGLGVHVGVLCLLLKAHVALTAHLSHHSGCVHLLVVRLHQSIHALRLGLAHLVQLLLRLLLVELGGLALLLAVGLDEVLLILGRKNGLVLDLHELLLRLLLEVLLLLLHLAELLLHLRELLGLRLHHLLLGRLLLKLRLVVQLGHAHVLGLLDLGVRRGHSLRALDEVVDCVNLS